MRKCVFILLLFLFAVTGFSSANNPKELPDGLRYRQIRKIISRDNRRLFKSAEKFFKKGKYSLSDQSYLSAVGQGDEFYGNWGRACTARQSKEILSASKLYAAAYILNDSLESFLYDYARFLHQDSQDWNQIAKISTRLYAVTKEDEALSILLETAARLNQRPAALKSLQELVKRYPIRANAQVYYASLLYETGQKEVAVTVARKAIQITQEPFQLKLLVLLLAQEGYFIEGAQACEKLSKIAPHSAQTLEAWGFLEFQQGHYQNAATNYRKALNRDYRQATLLSLARLNAFYLNDPDQAIYYVKAIMNLERNNCDALYIMAEVKRRQGNIPAALKYSVRLMELQPEHPQTYYYIGKLYLQIKDYANAVKYLETAVQYNPEIKRYRLVLAKAYAGAGMMDKARETYTNYLNEPLKDLWQEENMLKGTPPLPR